MKGANLVFRVNGQFAQEDAAIAAAWEAHYHKTRGVKTQCLVTGKPDVAESVHPPLRALPELSPVARPLCLSMRLLSAPMARNKVSMPRWGKYAAFAYTSALNYLLADRDNVHRIGGDTIVCWAEGAGACLPKIRICGAFWGATS